MIEVWVAGTLRNPLNGSWGGWRKHSRLARTWREMTAGCLLVEWINAGRPKDMANPRIAKRVTFTAHVGRLWDDDNLPAALKPVRDQVAAHCCGGDDGPTSGHEFRYQQVVDRQRGVTIRVEAR